MNFQLLNPFSDKFLDFEPDKTYKREVTTKLNTFGVGEDTLDIGKLVRGYGANSVSPSYPYEQNNIIFDSIFTTKRQRINFYRDMSQYAFIKKLISIICDECCSRNAAGEVAKFDIDEAYKDEFTDVEFRSIQKEFNYVINAVLKKKNIWRYFKKWLVDGELFLEIALTDDKTNIAGVKILPPGCTMCVYEEGIINGFVQDPSLMNVDNKAPIKTFTRNQVAYGNFGEYGTNMNDVRGLLEAAIKPVNQLRAIQDALTVYRITRAPEKRIWKIYGGGMPTAKQQEYLQQCIAQYRRDLNLDPHTGLVNGSQNTQALTQDIWFMLDRNGQGSTVEPFTASTTFNGQLEDVLMFREECADALEVPATRWKTEAGSSQYVQGTEGLSIDESSFQKRCARWSEQFCEIITQLLIVQLQAQGYDEKYLDSTLYRIELIPATDSAQFRLLAMAEKRGGVLGTVSTMMPSRANIKDDGDEPAPILSKQFVMEKYLGMTSDEILLNEQMLEQEIAAMKNAADAAKEEGGDSEEEDAGGGDMEF